MTIWESEMREVMGIDKPLKLVDEFTEFGLLEDAYNRIETGKVVESRYLLRDLLVQETVAQVILSIEKRNMQASV